MNCTDTGSVFHFCGEQLTSPWHTFQIMLKRLFQQVVLENCVCLTLTSCYRVCMYSPEPNLTCQSSLLHTPCQQVGSYLSLTELSHWAHTWPCHYRVPGFVSSLLSPFCALPGFPFPRYLNRDKNRVCLPPSHPRHIHAKHTHLSVSFSLLFVKEALFFFSQAGLDCDLPLFNSATPWQHRGRTLDQTFSLKYKAFLMLYMDPLPVKHYSLYTANRAELQRQTGTGGTVGPLIPQLCAALSPIKGKK